MFMAYESRCRIYISELKILGPRDEEMIKC